MREAYEASVGMIQAGTQVGLGRLGWQAAQAETTETKACIEEES